MRPQAGFNSTAAAAPAILSSSAISSDHSAAWHLTITYLFGGLAAMLGFIALAFLALACSYWKLSGYLEGSNNGRGRSSDQEREASKLKQEMAAVPVRCCEAKVVIMAGNEKPTFIATPISSRASSSVDHSGHVVDVGMKNEYDCKEFRIEMVRKDDEKSVGNGNSQI